MVGSIGRIDFQIFKFTNFQITLAVSGAKIEVMNPKVKSLRRQNIRFRIRRKIGEGTAEKPRLSLFRSNTDIYVQLIDDLHGQTLAAASSKEKSIAAQKVNKSEKSKLVGEAIAKKAAELGIKSVVFDRGGYLYHGRVKSVADGAREGGLQF